MTREENTLPKEHGVLWNDGDVRTEHVQSELSDIQVVQVDVSGLERIDETQQRDEQRGFARAGATYDADLFTGSDGKRDVLQHERQVRSVLQRHVEERNLPRVWPD